MKKRLTASSSALAKYISNIVAIAAKKNITGDVICLFIDRISSK